MGLDDGPHRPLKEDAFLSIVGVSKCVLVPAKRELLAPTLGSSHTKTHPFTRILCFLCDIPKCSCKFLFLSFWLESEWWCVYSGAMCAYLYISIDIYKGSLYQCVYACDIDASHFFV